MQPSVEKYNISKLNNFMSSNFSRIQLSDIVMIYAKQEVQLLLW